MNHCLLMMGGSGTRFGSDRPKQYTLVDEAPLFSYILKRLDNVTEINTLVVVSHGDWLDYVNEWAEKVVKNKRVIVVGGGINRSHSVKNGLLALESIANREDVVLIHDATHPYVDVQGIQAVIDAVKRHGGATLASRNYDTVYRTTEDGFLEAVEPRELIVAGASPEAFTYGTISDVYLKATDDELACMTSAGAIALANHIPMKVVPSPILNLKITYADDMKLFLMLFHNYFFPEEER